MAERKSGSALSREEYDSWRVFIETIVDLVGRGVIAEDRIDHSVARIERMLG